MIRKAKAVWRGTGRAGSGHLSTDSGVLAQTPYSFKTRFEKEKGPTPRSSLPPHMPAVSPWHLPFSSKAAATLPRS
jgi:osmotically inducible protein OsmC